MLIQLSRGQGGEGEAGEGAVEGSDETVQATHMYSGGSRGGTGRSFCTEYLIKELFASAVILLTVLLTYVVKTNLQNGLPFWKALWCNPKCPSLSCVRLQPVYSYEPLVFLICKMGPVIPPCNIVRKVRDSKCKAV